MNCYKMIAAIALGVSLMVPESAPAFQSHPEPEGLYVHQLAHVFFIVAMAFLAYWLEADKFTAKKGWRLVQISCLLLILWNIDAIAGHWVEEKIPDRSLIGEPDWTQRINLNASPWVPLYYVLKLDHLLCVPAIFCLFAGIRLLFKSALEEEGGGND